MSRWTGGPCLCRQISPIFLALLFAWGYFLSWMHREKSCSSHNFSETRAYRVIWSACEIRVPHLLWPISSSLHQYFFCFHQVRCCWIVTESKNDPSVNFARLRNRDEVTERAIQQPILSSPSSERSYSCIRMSNVGATKDWEKLLSASCVSLSRFFGLGDILVSFEHLGVIGSIIRWAIWAFQLGWKEQTVS